MFAPKSNPCQLPQFAMPRADAGSWCHPDKPQQEHYTCGWPPRDWLRGAEEARQQSISQPPYCAALILTYAPARGACLPCTVAWPGRHFLCRQGMAQRFTKERQEGGGGQLCAPCSGRAAEGLAGNPGPLSAAPGQQCTTYSYCASSKHTACATTGKPCSHLSSTPSSCDGE
jgi:hypothetical protein